LALTGGSARRATRRSIRQTMTCVKFLLTYGENKFLIAVATIQGLVTECHVSFSILGPNPHCQRRYASTAS
jgi:hypothetical protein